MENNITAGQFKKGSIPWNRGMKGIHLSPSTEFKKGRISTDRLPVGTVTIRTKKKDGKGIAWVKVADPSEWRPRAQVVWEEYYGPLPDGLILHRKDGDTLNDDITNLVPMTRGDHLRWHRPEFEEKRREATSIAMKERWKEYRESKYDRYYWQN